MSDLVAEFRWASETGEVGLPALEELEYLGYRRMAQHPVYPRSWLMRRDCQEGLNDDR